MKLYKRLSRILYKGKEGHANHYSPVEEGYLYDSEGYALYDIDGFVLDTME